MAKRLLAKAGRSCGLRCCACCGCRAQQAASTGVALVELAPAGEEAVQLQVPLPTPGMRAPESRQLSPEEAGDLTLDMHRYYSKHHLPSLAHYGARSHPNGVSRLLWGTPISQKNSLSCKDSAQGRMPCMAGMS